MATELPAKRTKTAGPVIGTHNGHFHADEALAVYLLRLLPTYAAASVLRTRDPELLASCHTVVDVGGTYDDAARRYDHHQRGFAAYFPDHSATPLSSAGLVWLHYGRAVIAARTGLAPDSDAAGVLWRKLYSDFVEAVDANDNGVSAYDAAAAGPPRFKAGGFTLASLVGDLNHPVDLEGPLPGTPAHEATTGASGSQASLADVYAATAAASPTNPEQAAEDARFQRASALMGSALLRKLHRLHSVWLPARAVVQAAFAERHSYDPRGRLLVLANGSVPWKEHLFALEAAEATGVTAGPAGIAVAAAPAQAAVAATAPELHAARSAAEYGTAVERLETQQDAALEQSSAAKGAAATLGRVLYVLYPESEAPDSRWRVQAVPVDADSFVSRCPLPEPWRGLRDQALDAASGVAGCVFVHASGFIGGNTTREGAMEMARKSVEMAGGLGEAEARGHTW